VVDLRLLWWRCDLSSDGPRDPLTTSLVLLIGNGANGLRCARTTFEVRVRLLEIPPRPRCFCAPRIVAWFRADSAKLGQAGRDHGARGDVGRDQYGGRSTRSSGSTAMLGSKRPVRQAWFQNETVSVIVGGSKG
jgi:hypothetical protein